MIGLQPDFLNGWFQGLLTGRILIVSARTEVSFFSSPAPGRE
jgi:hypothetical protein